MWFNSKPNGYGWIVLENGIAIDINWWGFFKKKKTEWIRVDLIRSRFYKREVNWFLSKEELNEQGLMWLERDFIKERLIDVFGFVFKRKKTEWAKTDFLASGFIKESLTDVFF